MKAYHEKKVLKEFLKVLDSKKYFRARVISKQPPEPDLLVKSSISEEYFEVSRILDSFLMNLKMIAQKIAPKMIDVDTKKIGLSERDVLVKKLKKSYTTNSKPVSLVLYYDKGFYFGGFPPIPLTTFLEDIVRPLADGDQKFENIFYFDRNRKQLIWQKK